MSWSNLQRLLEKLKNDFRCFIPETFDLSGSSGYQDVACWLVQWWTSCESCHSIFHHAYRREVWPKQWRLLGLRRHFWKIVTSFFSLLIAINECFEDATVDASEIRRSPPGMVIKPVVNNWIFHLPTSTGAFPPDFWLPSGKNVGCVAFQAVAHHRILPSFGMIW